MQQPKMIGSTVSQSVEQRFARYQDANARSKAAIAENPKFFLGHAHSSRVHVATKLAEQFYGKVKYVNRRPGGSGHKPMTVLKIVDPNWGPDDATEERQVARKLDEMGNVFRKYSKRSNSLLIQIK